MGAALPLAPHRRLDVNKLVGSIPSGFSVLASLYVYPEAAVVPAMRMCNAGSRAILG